MEEGTRLALEAFAGHPEFARDLGQVVRKLAIFLLTVAAQIEAARPPGLLQRRFAGPRQRHGH